MSSSNTGNDAADERICKEEERVWKRPRCDDDDNSDVNNRRREKPGRRSYCHPMANVLSLIGTAPLLVLEHRTQQQREQQLEADNCTTEERLLLFRSNGSGKTMGGPIGKLIFTTCCTTVTEEKATILLQAKITVVHVKPEYRNCGLGAVLMTQLWHCLKQQQQKRHNSCTAAINIVCDLDAEEEVGRHGKLVRFYQVYGGFEIQPNSKIQYLYNNDGEMYRKVPMQRRLLQQHRHHGTVESDSLLFMQEPKCLFFPVQFKCETTTMTTNGLLQQVTDNHSEKQLNWLVLLLLTEKQQHEITFQTTRGDQLKVLNDGGAVHIVSLEDNHDDDDYDHAPQDTTKFVLSKVDHLEDPSLFVIQTAHVPPFFLSRTLSGLFQCHSRPVLWKQQQQPLLPLDKFNHRHPKQQQSSIPLSKSNHSPTMVTTWICTGNTIQRQFHLQQHALLQTADYVQTMRLKYLQFSLGRWSLWNMLERAQQMPGQYHHDGHRLLPCTFMGRCFTIAERVRHAGHPDWEQLLALVYHLGHAAVASSLVIEQQLLSIARCQQLPSLATATEHSSFDYDWTLASPKWVVGTNNTAADSTHVLLTWTGPEYMYHFLVHNQVRIPREGLACFHWANVEQVPFSDIDAQAVAEFATLVGDDKDNDINMNWLSDVECQVLWQNRYQYMAQKYGLDGVLEW